MSRPAALFVTTVPITLEAFLAPFATRLRELGWRVDAVANGATRSEHIATAFDRRFDVAWSRNPLDPRNLIGSAGRIREIVDEGAYDIVHVHTPIAAFVTRFALRSRHGRPVVIYTAHGFHFYRGQAPLPHAVYRGIERLAGRWTDYLVTINYEDFSAAQQLGTIDPQRVRLIRGIGVDTQRFDSGSVTADEVDVIRRQLDVDSDAFMLTMIAEMAPVKRHAHLLEALARVTDGRVVLALVGEGPLESELRDRVRTLGIDSRVRWAGYRRDIPAVLAASDALVLVSEREGLNRSVLEAMAAARPVIGTDTRGIADAVGPEGGWIVAKNDVAALASAIEDAAAHPDECRARGAAGRARAEKEFSFVRIVAAYEDLYREALV